MNESKETKIGGGCATVLRLSSLLDTVKMGKNQTLSPPFHSHEMPSDVESSAGKEKPRQCSCGMSSAGYLLGVAAGRCSAQSTWWGS